jgi:type II secretory pathway predicted ATPase ExeA
LGNGAVEQRLTKIMKNAVIIEIIEDLKAYFKSRPHRFAVLSGDMGTEKDPIIKMIVKELRTSNGFTIASMDQHTVKINDTMIINKLLRMTGCKRSYADQEIMARRVRDRKILLVINDAHELRDKSLFSLKRIYEIGVSILLTADLALGEKLQSVMYEELWCAQVFKIQSYVGSTVS